jgi:hypothetical protein
MMRSIFNRLFASVWALGCLVMAPALSAQQFRHAAYYKLGPNLPHHVIAADLRGNGTLDLVTADYLSNRVTVLLGNGNGTFQAPRSLPVPNAYWLAAGDFNEDGKLDLAVVESSRGTGVLQFLLGDGDGKFHLGESYNTGVTPISVAVADFNGDGHLDVVLSNEAGYKNAGSVMVFFGTGRGTFGKPATYKVQGSPWAVAAGDLNGDHQPDLAVTNINGNISVLLNDGTGHFGKPASYDAGGGEIVDVKIGDLRHDGRNDLVVANASLSAVGVLLNTSDGNFAAVKLYPTSLPGESTGADGVVIADFNLDGKLDLAASNQDGNSALFYGKGDGTFKDAISIHNEIKFDGAIGLTVGDFNHDKAPDLAFAMYFKPKVAILLNAQ